MQSGVQPVLNGLAIRNLESQEELIRSHWRKAAAFLLYMGRAASLECGLSYQGPYPRRALMNSHHLFRLAIAAVIVAAIACAFALQAGAAPFLVVHQLGVQDYQHRAIVTSASSFEAAGVGEPSPFDGTIFGDDNFGAPGAFNFTHAIELQSMTPLSATLTLGIVDHDSFTAAADTIDLFFDGIQQNDAQFRASPLRLLRRALFLCPLILRSCSMACSWCASRRW